MCAVSMVHDFYRNNIPIQQWADIIPNQRKDVWDKLNEILEVVKRIDKKLSQPDCVDPEKEKYIKEIKDLLEKLGNN